MQRSPSVGSQISVASSILLRERSGSNASLRKTIHSTYSIGSEAGGVASTLGVLVVLKIIFVDILITGFGDAITDLLQVLKVFAES